jgi:hypothetical protein
MARNITVTFSDGTSHTYQNAPDNLTPDMVQQRAQQDFGKTVTALDGGKSAASNGIPGPRAEPTTYEKIRPYVAPTVEALGAAGGGIIGAPFGPAGIAGGAGLGYGIAKEAVNLADVYLGGKAPRQGAAIAIEPIKNVLEGATYEVGGRVAAPVIGKAIGAIADLRQLPLQKAATIAKGALGEDLPQVLNALRNAPSNLNAAQATASITNPTWQALIERRLASDPKFVLNLKNMNEAEGVNALAQLAGGATATQARNTAETAKNALNAVTGPLRESALARANLGQATQQYASEAERLAAEAAGKVQDVRRFTAAGPRAEALARTQLIEKGQPVGAAKYTYVGGDLPTMAEQAAADAAAGSLKLGEASRFSQAASDALSRVGIKPLETAPIVNSITQMASKPEFAGNRDVSTALKRVAQDVTEWTNSGGVIDAWALDAIRKNSVNAAIRDLYPAADIKVQKELAAGVLTRIKPVIVDAIESAGGTGYRQYLADFTKGMQQISEKKLSGEALNLYKTNKDQFVRLVQGESPDVVEKILGPGSYNIAKEVSDNTLSVLQDQAAKVIRDANIKTQVAGGQDALKELMLQNLSKIRLPSYITAVAATTNKAMQILENKIGAKTLGTLTEAFKTPGATADLLETLPGAERSRVANLLSNPESWVQKAAAPTAIGVTNALSPNKQNNLR